LRLESQTLIMELEITPSQIQNGTIHLTFREMEVLRYIVKGYSNKEISNEMNRSANTIKTHIKNIYSKLQINRRVHALIKAKELNIT